MSALESHPQKSSATPSRSLLRRPVFWLATLGLFAAVTTARLLKASPPPSDPLHGDAEEAADTLMDIMAKTPAEKRLPILLRDIQDSSPGLRYAAADGLGGMRDKAAADALDAAFQDSSLFVRTKALESLPDIDPERGFRLLLAGLRDDDTQIRTDALAQLASRIGAKKLPHPERALPTLLSLLDSTDGVETGNVLFTLHKLTGKPWIVKSNATPQQRQIAIAQWKQWAKENPAALAVPPYFQNVAPRLPNRADPAPDFSLPDLDGKPISLEGQKGRVTLLNFWGTWCGPCQSEIPDLVKISRDFKARNADVIGLALSEDSEDAFQTWCKSHGVTYRQAMATPEMQRVFGNVHELPVSILIDKQGKIRSRWDGPGDYATFRAAFERLLKE